MAIELTTQDYLDLALADLEQTRTENERLTDCLEETIDELLCGNRLYAQLTDRLKASNQARQEAVRELEAERIRHQQDVDIDSDCRRDLKSRLTKAEEALRGLHRWLTDPGVKVLCEGLPEQMGYSGACQKVVAALQPETDDPAAKYYPPDALQSEGEKK